jgi:4-hydroxyphenylacetate 3-monooxygenase oxygenase component
MVPRTKEDLIKRREAMKIWADASFGMLGRSPDFLNTTVMTFADGADFFAKRGEDFAANARTYYKYCRDNDLFLTHALVNPQTDRSRISSEQEDKFVHLGVVDETAEGLIVRGAKLLATHAPIADELLIYPTPGMRTGDERYVLCFAVPVDAPGLRLICREPFDQGEQKAWDHPLGARFEEPDAVIVFDDVLIPWSRVFLYGDVSMANAMYAEVGLRNHTGHQTAVRGLSKSQFVTGVAVALTRTVKTDVFLHVQEQLGELLGYLQLIEGAILMAEEKAERTRSGSLRPAYNPLQALRYHLPRMYERMINVTQVVGAGGLLINPTEADLNSPIGGDIERYYRGAGVDARRRIQLYKLAWDVTGTQFGQRMLQYERYYAGDPVRVGAAYYLAHDVSELLDQVERALSEPVERLMAEAEKRAARRA